MCQWSLRTDGLNWSPHAHDDVVSLVVEIDGSSNLMYFRIQEGSPCPLKIPPSVEFWTISTAITGSRTVFEAKNQDCSLLVQAELEKDNPVSITRIPGLTALTHHSPTPHI
jgi:hypothetical protein